jgi:glucokinase
MILAGDVGGTHTRLALFEEEGAVQKVDEARFRSRDYPNLLSLVQEYTRDKKNKIHRACFAVAGPIRERRCKLTNIPNWIVDANEMQEALNIRSVLLLNDLEAHAWGLSVLEKKDLLVLHKGNPKQVGNAALVSAGTGLGEAGLYWDGKKHRPFACEGGHTDFAARNAREFELFSWLQKKYGRHVSYERLISGPGLHSLYQFLVQKEPELGNKFIMEEMEKRDPPAVISEFGKKRQDRACVQTLDWFLSLYGAEAGNAALKFLALGGVYIGGGIAPVLVEQMKQSEFMASFLDKGRFKGLLETIPVHIVLNDETALLGTAVYARYKH